MVEALEAAWISDELAGLCVKDKPQATLQRGAGEALVLCVQDTTDVDISQFARMMVGTSCSKSGLALRLVICACCRQWSQCARPGCKPSM